MDPKVFQEKLEQLGKFRRRFGGRTCEESWEDYIFVVNKTQRPCELCPENSPGRSFIYEVKFDRKRPYWRTKCQHCRETWQNLHL